jgi:membrane fusion protein (multidrug efflux system)
MVPQASKNKYAVPVGLLGLAIVLSFLYYFKVYSKHSPNEHEGLQGIPVTTLTLQKKPIEIQQSLPGRIVPHEVAELRPQITGIISQRYFTEGSFVKQGQQLYQIDPAPYEAAYNSAVANLNKANANFQLADVNGRRATKLVNDNAISVQDYDNAMAQLAQAKADVGVAKAAVETAKINLNFTKMYAPISGHIGKSDLTKGALVTANQANALATITQMDPIFVDLTLPIHDFTKIYPYLIHPNHPKLLLFIENKPKPYPHEGKIQFTDITVSETTNSVLLRTLFPNPNQILLPGLFINVDIRFGTVESILIPTPAVIHNPDGSASVWLINNKNQVHPKTIQVGHIVDHQWVVHSGVNVGDKIVLSGVQHLKPGALIHPDTPKKETH